MRGGTHLVIGIAAGVIVARMAAQRDVSALLCIAAAGIGELLPDIDHPRAMISRYTPGVGHTARLLVSHRGATHSLLFVVVVMVLLALASVPPAIMGAAGVGLLSHLVADMLTPAGVPLLKPLSHRAFRLLPRPMLWVSASFLEALALVGSVVVIALVIVGRV